MDLISHQLDWLIFILKILVSVLCGISIGIEREILKKPAGIKTNSLICLGAALFTHFSMSVSGGDPTRVAAQVVSGIGFIGAGTIIHSKKGIEGLTSAAIVFVNASIGMLIGGGFFAYGILSTIILLILFTALRHIRIQHQQNSYHIFITAASYEPIETLLTKFDTLNCVIQTKKIEKTQKILSASINYSTSPLQQHQLISFLHTLNGVISFKQT